MSPVVFVLTVSLLIAALALRSVSLFKRASLVPDLWVVDQKIQGMLPDTERAQQRVRSLHIAYNPLKNVAKCLCTLVMVVFAAMLPATASAAPTVSTSLVRLMIKGINADRVHPSRKMSYAL